jgi:competence protein ComEA
MGGTGPTSRNGSKPGPVRGGGLARTGALSVVLLVTAGVGTFLVRRWPDPGPALKCPADAIGWTDAGGSPLAVCHVGGALPADVALALGRPVNLNQVPEDTLARLPGIGARVARDLVAARARAPFRRWEDVDAVRGVGPARITTLQRCTMLGP